MTPAEICNDSNCIDTSFLNIAGIKSEDFFFTQISETRMLCIITAENYNKNKIVDAVNAGMFELYSSIDRLESQWDCTHFEINAKTGNAVLFCQDMRTLQ